MANVSDQGILRFQSRRIVDEKEAVRWLCQAENDLKVMKKVASCSEGGPFFADAVWYANQVVEKSLKSAMLGTCGLTQSEYTGEDCHNIVAFHERLKHGSAATEPQRQAQRELPGDAHVMHWLKDAYLATRYPNAASSVPSDAYTGEDAEKAQEIADQILCWAKRLEDLPEPKATRQTGTEVAFKMPPASTAQRPRVNRKQATQERSKLRDDRSQPKVSPPSAPPLERAQHLDLDDLDPVSRPKQLPPASMKAVSRGRVSRVTLGCGLAVTKWLVRGPFPWAKPGRANPQSFKAPFLSPPVPALLLGRLHL